MAVLISLAKSEKTGVITHISDVDKTLAGAFSCVRCQQNLIPVKSKARKKDWHFRHSVETSCDGDRETALHKYAVQILVENSEIVLTKDISISYSNARKEVRIFDYRSDVMVSSGCDEIHFEVFVTHDLDQDKKQMYRTNKVNCVRIDLSDRSLLQAEPGVIRAQVLDETRSKTLIFWKDFPEMKPLEPDAGPPSP